MSVQTCLETAPPTPTACVPLAELSQVLAAGARARAVADACEASGLAAVLLDGAGRVLHVGAAAASLLDADLRVEADHLLGRGAEANATIEAVLNPILGRAFLEAPTAAVPARAVTAGGTLMIAAAGYDDGLPYQLLRAVVLLGRDTQALNRGLQGLRISDRAAAEGPSPSGPSGSAGSRSPASRRTLRRPSLPRP